MTGFPVLDVVIGLSFVYLLLALICTTVMEWIAQVLEMRGKMLKRSVRQVLDVGSAEDAPAPVTTAFYEHPLIRSLCSLNRGPSYIPGPVFAKALLDVLPPEQTDKRSRAEEEPGEEEPGDQEPNEKRVEPSAGLQRCLKTLGRGDPSLDPTAVAEWYDQVMDRTCGAYKRTTRKWIIGLALGLTVMMNADTVKLVGNLWQNPTLRAYVVERARVRLEQGPPLETVEYTDPSNPKPTEPIEPDTTKGSNSVLAEEQALLGDLFGWSGEWTALRASPVSWSLLHLLGWVLTALAVSLGAPFWFDTLNRFMNLRAAGKTPAKTGESESPKTRDNK